MKEFNQGEFGLYIYFNVGENLTTYEQVDMYVRAAGGTENERLLVSDIGTEVVTTDDGVQYDPNNYARSLITEAETNQYAIGSYEYRVQVSSPNASPAILLKTDWEDAVITVKE